MRFPSGPLKEEGVMPKLMRRYPNLYGDLSDIYAIARDPDYGPQFLTEFQDRLLFGTDICFFEHEIVHGKLLRLREQGKISDTVSIAGPRERDQAAGAEVIPLCQTRQGFRPRPSNSPPYSGPARRLSSHGQGRSLRSSATAHL